MAVISNGLPVSLVHSLNLPVCGVIIEACNVVNPSINQLVNLSIRGYVYVAMYCVLDLCALYESFPYTRSNGGGAYLYYTLYTCQVYLEI